MYRLPRAALIAGSAFEKLISLDLVYCGLNDDSVAPLWTAGNPTLRRLDLRGNHLGAAGLSALSHSAAAFPQLRTLGVDLTYRDGSLEAMIKNRAEEVATKIVMRTSHSMALEDQKNSEERLRNAIKELADELRYELPRALWDLK